jgi:DNA replication protein DnaC
MINQLVAAEADHTLLKKLQYYQSQDLLVCDEIGYLPLGRQGSNLFFQVISARHEKKSTIITTNLLCGAPHNRFNAEYIVMRRNET